MREWSSAVISIVITAAISLTGGALGGLLYARSQAPPLRVQVLDMRRMVEVIAQDPTLDDTSRRVRTEEVSNVVSRFVSEQASRGVIILDASAVLRAPPDAYLHP